MSRIRANNITNGAGTGAPIFPNGAVINGIATITSDVSSFSNLSVNKVSLGTGTTLSGEDNNALKILTNGSERVTVSAGGSVGIGTTQPVYTLNISNGASSGMQIGVGTHSYRLRANVSGSNDFGFYIEDNEGSDLYNVRGKDSTSNPNLHRWYTNTTGVSSERLRIGPEGQIGLGGNNYGTAGQVLKSNGNSTGPTWQNLSQFVFYGRQDSTQNIANTTYTRVRNFGNDAVNVGDASIAVWDEDNGTLTIGDDGAGIYFLYCSVGIDDLNNGEYVRAVIGKNGGTTSLGTQISAYMDATQAGSNTITTSQVSTIAELAADDVVRFYIRHTEGATVPTEANRTTVGGYKLN
jgi:hypothetical protein|tara:strand:+ start:694 stop:1746 length:1053 start_codon:yes stop_codon:yes gene_type:complete